MHVSDMTDNENEPLSEKDWILSAIKNRHKRLGQKIENATTSTTIEKNQAHRRKIRDFAVNNFDIDRAEVNQWE